MRAYECQYSLMLELQKLHTHVSANATASDKLAFKSPLCVWGHCIVPVLGCRLTSSSKPSWIEVMESCPYQFACPNCNCGEVGCHPACWVLMTCTGTLTLESELFRVSRFSSTCFFLKEPGGAPKWTRKNKHVWKRKLFQLFSWQSWSWSQLKLFEELT